MGKISSITCDNCGKELVVDSSYPHHFSLMLSCVDTGINTSDMQYAVMMYPPIKGDKYFCNEECLIAWLIPKEKDAPQNNAEGVAVQQATAKGMQAQKDAPATV